jgi:hypothetical protein
MKDSNDKILDRIRKLLAMAGDTSSPHEAAIAAKRARALMDKHQVSDVDLTTLDASDMGDKVTGMKQKTNNLFTSVLSVAVATYNDCQVRYVRKNGYLELKFEGMLVDCVCAYELFKYLRNQAYQQAERYEVGRKDRHAYRVGFSSGVAAQVKEMQKEREQIKMEMGSQSGTSLVVCKQQLVRQHFDPVNYTNSTSSYSGSRNAHGNGFTAGKKAGLNRQVSGSSRKALA